MSATAPSWPLQELLPQQGPMILLDSVMAGDSERLTARVTVRKGGMFFEPGRGVAAHCAIEWMAQACAAFIGLEARTKGEPVRLGLLLGTRDFAAELSWFREGDALDVRVEPAFRDGEMAVFDCKVSRQGETSSLAHAQLTVYQPADVDALMRRQREEWPE